ncbi:11105_t:CDS:2, partial [Scutellospora calospora]
ADIVKDSNIDDQACAYFKKIETGDESTLALWKRFKNLSIERYKDTYAYLNVNFDIYSGESQISKYKLDVAIIQKNDSTILYITRDIGAAME